MTQTRGASTGWSSRSWRGERFRLQSPVPMRFHLDACLIASLFALASPASADPGPPAMPAPVAEHTARADRARLGGRCEDAVAAYRDALAEAERAGLPPEKRAPILGDLGACEVTLRRYRDGAEHLHLAMRHKDTFTPAQRWRFEQAQKKAEREVVMVFIEAEPPDAEVTLDGEPLSPRRPRYLVFAEPGPHTVRASLEGHEDHVSTFSSPAGGWPLVHLRPRPLQAPAAHAAPRPVHVPVLPRDDLAPKLRVVGFVASGIGVAAGIGFSIAGQIAHDRLKERGAELRPVLGDSNACNGERHRTECGDLLVLQSTRDSLDIAARGAFIAGGLLGTLALTSLWWAPADNRPASVQVGVLATPSAGSAQLRWTW